MKEALTAIRVKDKSVQPLANLVLRNTYKDIRQKERTQFVSAIKLNLSQQLIGQILKLGNAWGFQT
jgi:ABC-type transporter MlaC component